MRPIRRLLLLNVPARAYMKEISAKSHSNSKSSCPVEFREFDTIIKGILRYYVDCSLQTYDSLS